MVTPLRLAIVCLLLVPSSGYPTYIGCDFKVTSTKSSSGRNVMTGNEKIMGALPSDSSILATASTMIFSAGSTVTITFHHSFVRGLVHSTAGAFTAQQFSAAKESSAAACTGTNTIKYKTVADATNTITWTAPADVSALASVTISVAGAPKYGIVSRQRLTLSKATTTTMEKHIAEAKKIIVDTTGTARNGDKSKPYLASVDTIDRTLNISFDLPALTQNGSAGGAAGPASLCGRTWTCAKQQFDVTPGMSVTTAQVRDFTTEANFISNTMYKPTFGFTATQGKKYSMLMVDLMQPAFAAVGMTEYLHYAALNVDNAAALNALSGASQTQEFGSWVSPGNPMAGPSTYVHLLFEHDAALSFKHNYTVAKEIARSSKKPMPVPFNLTAFLAETKLDTAKLIAANWFKAAGSAVSREKMMKMGAMGAMALGMFKGTCADMMPCRSCTGTLDMCNAKWKPADCSAKAVIPTKQTNCTAAPTSTVVKGPMLLSVYDTNKDCKLSFTEFVDFGHEAATRAPATKMGMFAGKTPTVAELKAHDYYSAAVLPEINKSFTKADKDNDGFLSTAEFLVEYKGPTVKNTNETYPGDDIVLKGTNCKAAPTGSDTTTTTTSTKAPAGPTVVKGSIKFDVSMNASAAASFVKDAKVVLGVETGIASKLQLNVSWVKATLSVGAPAGRRLAANDTAKILVDFVITVPASATSAPSASKLETSLKKTDQNSKDEWKDALVTAIKKAAPAHANLKVTGLSVAHKPSTTPAPSSSSASTDGSGATSASVQASLPALGSLWVMMVATFI